MSGKDNNTPNKKGGPRDRNNGQQFPPSPSARALVELNIHPGNGQITFHNQTFANFDDVMQYIQEQPSHRRERLLHMLLSNMVDFRDHWSDQILRFADYFDSERNQNRFQELFYGEQDYENRWGILQERIQSVRNETARCRPIINRVIKRCPAESKDFYTAHFKPWGETRVTMERLAKWLSEPAENLTEKIRLIHNAAFDRCLHPARTGGHTNSLIPQAEDIKSCLDKRVSKRFITEVETQQLRNKAKDISHYAHVWRDPTTSIIYPRRPDHLIQANIPPTFLYPVPISQLSSQPTSPRSSPTPFNVSDPVCNLSSPDSSKETPPAPTTRSKRRRLSQASVQYISESMRDISNLAQNTLPQTRPSVSALGSRTCPLNQPNPVEHGLWEYAYDYATAFVKGVRQPKPPATQQLIYADVDALAAAVNRLNIGINQLPGDQREAGAVLFAKGLCCGVTMCTEAQSAQYLNQMYTIIRRWEQEFPSQPSGNIPGRRNQPVVPIKQGRQVDNNMGVMQSSLLTLVVDQGNPSGWLNDEIVNGGIAVRSDPAEIQVVNSLLWERLVLLQNDPGQLAANMPHIREDRIPALTFIPINRGQSHWVLGWIDTRSRQYGILDSFAGSSSTARHNIDMGLIRNFMRYYTRIYYSQQPQETTEPIYTINTTQGPQQTADDCGVFVIMNAWHMISGGRVGQLPWFNVMQRRLQIMDEIYQAASRMRAIPPAQRFDSFTSRNQGLFIAESQPSSPSPPSPHGLQSKSPQSSRAHSSQSELTNPIRSGLYPIQLLTSSAVYDASSRRNRSLFTVDSELSSPGPSSPRGLELNLQAVSTDATQNRRTPSEGITTPSPNQTSSSRNATPSRLGTTATNNTTSSSGNLNRPNPTLRRSRRQAGAGPDGWTPPNDG